MVTYRRLFFIVALLLGGLASESNADFRQLGTLDDRIAPEQQMESDSLFSIHISAFGAGKFPGVDLFSQAALWLSSFSSEQSDKKIRSPQLSQPQPIDVQRIIFPMANGLVQRLESLGFIEPVSQQATAYFNTLRRASAVRPQNIRNGIAQQQPYHALIVHLRKTSGIIEETIEGVYRVNSDNHAILIARIVTPEMFILRKSSDLSSDSSR